MKRRQLERKWQSLPPGTVLRYIGTDDTLRLALLLSSHWRLGLYDYLTGDLLWTRWGLEDLSLEVTVSPGQTINPVAWEVLVEPA